MSVTAAGLKSFLLGQKIASLALGLFILTNVWKAVTAINAKAFEPLAACLSKPLKEKINIGKMDFGCGVDSEGVVDALIVFMVALAAAYVVMKMARITPGKIPVFAGIPFSL